MDIDDIRNRAQGVAKGRVTAEELEFARSILLERRGDVGSALYIVGWCGSVSDAVLIESYLYGPERDLHGETALKALCRYLRLIDRYRPLLRELIMSPTDVGWTNSRMAAIQLAPNYLSGFQDDELGCQLVSILCDPNDPEQPSARAALVEILALRSELRDPFGLHEENGDMDAGYIVKLACQRFGCGRRVQ
ncbi:hypothetical protein EOA85_19900 [Mesorhizobium sp. M5C.F.Ca.IN.020.29.1.1]|uniref:hypothetical protein n=1 Tax=unclassified Mesorhizobium TaxID=325217 RepID=UPI000FCB4B48|nr:MULTISPECIES: hypothetical protein [unclassified Mesorhizobium]RUV56015.1 hypothetical protein EOA85_19900 [Mesorhizobium sp. M5C.F.Ca.IN.020.29.1.1]TIM83282.1 MAG: hypothetical protein E5Y50_26150 [Mesorhizobium sp.]